MEKDRTKLLGYAISRAACQVLTLTSTKGSSVVIRVSYQNTPNLLREYACKRQSLVTRCIAIFVELRKRSANSHTHASTTHSGCATLAIDTRTRLPAFSCITTSSEYPRACPAIASTGQHIYSHQVRSAYAPETQLSRKRHLPKRRVQQTTRNASAPQPIVQYHAQPMLDARRYALYEGSMHTGACIQAHIPRCNPITNKQADTTLATGLIAITHVLLKSNHVTKRRPSIQA